MLSEISEVRPTGGTRLFLRFDDGAAGELDLADLCPDGLHARLTGQPLPGPLAKAS